MSIREAEPQLRYAVPASRDAGQRTDSSQAVRVLTAFMCSKLEDLETIVPALKGINALASQPSFAATDAVDVTRA